MPWLLIRGAEHFVWGLVPWLLCSLQYKYSPPLFFHHRYGPYTTFSVQHGPYFLLYLSSKHMYTYQHCPRKRRQRETETETERERLVLSEHPFLDESGASLYFVEKKRREIQLLGLNFCPNASQHATRRDRDRKAGGERENDSKQILDCPTATKHIQRGPKERNPGFQTSRLRLLCFHLPLPTLSLSLSHSFFSPHPRSLYRNNTPIHIIVMCGVFRVRVRLSTLPPPPSLSPRCVHY